MPWRLLRCLNTASWCALLISVGTTDMALAQADGCMASESAAIAGPFGYSSRGARCEGLLKRYFGRGDDIELVGYTSGAYDMSAPELEMSVLSKAVRADALTIRAMSLTSLVRYQMDTTVKGNQAFRWPLELLLRAKADRKVQLDLATLAIVGCTNRCSRRNETQYLPVAVRSTRGPAARPLVLTVRADADATDVRATLSPTGGQPIALVPDPPALSPDALTKFVLPADITPGEYRLEVRARDSRGTRWMSSLLAQIVVP